MRLLLATLASYLLCAADLSFAQTVPSPPAVTYSNQLPTFGAGHDYIQMAGETVNPANGSVSLRIGLPLPSARGLHPQFNIAYDSSSLYGIQPVGESNFNLVTTHLMLGLPQSPDLTGLAYGSTLYGWSESIPNLQASRSSYRPAFTFNTANDTLCGYTQGFVFTDTAGSKHAFDTRVYSGVVGSGPCENANAPVRVYSLDRMYQAVFIPDGGSTIAGPDGTTYTFPALFSISSTGGDPYETGTRRAYPQLIQDRNGNRLDGIGQIGLAYQLKDALGRNSLGISNQLDGSGYLATSTYTVSGLSNAFRLNWGTQHIAASNTLPFSVVFHVGYNCEESSSSSQGGGSDIRVPTSLSLPDGNQYSFEYDTQYGLLSKLTYPNGGVVSYEWGLPGSMTDQADYRWSSGSQSNGQEYSISYTESTCSARYQLPVLKKRTVSFDGQSVAQTQTFAYTTTMGAPDNVVLNHWTDKSTTVVTTDQITGKSTTTVYAYKPSDQMSPDSVTLGPGPTTFRSGGSPAVEDAVTIKDGSSTIQTQTKTWVTPSHISTVKTTLADGSTTETDTSYTGVILLPSETSVYDYGSGSPGALLRKTKVDYASFPETPNFPGGAGYQGHPAMPSLLGFPSKTSTYDGGNNLVAETDFGYDETAVSATTPVQHDDENYSSSSTASRANVTSITRKCWPNCSDLKTTMTYDAAGQVMSVTNATQHTTDFSYADSFVSGTGNPTGTTDAFLTSIKSPTVNGQRQTTTAKFGFNDSKLRTLKDANEQTTTYCYNTGGCGGTASDAWLRLTEITNPDGGGTTATYSDVGANPTTTRKQKLDGSREVASVSKQNGFNQLIQTQLTSDPQGTVYTDTSMDGLGRPRTISNPYRVITEDTYGNTTTDYDALGRKITLTSPGGKKQSWTYTGNSITFKDEALKTWTTTSDGLGRIIKVVEPGQLTTTYSYDALGNLLCADQWGTDTPGQSCSGLRWRKFTYDSLSRIVTANNPETGTLTYRYRTDAGLLCSGNADLPCKKTDARAKSTFYTFDALDRLTCKSFSDGTRPQCFGYDGKDEGGNDLGAPWSTNGVGRLTHTSDGISVASNYAYDVMGRLAQKADCLPSGCSYTDTQKAEYNFAGNIATFQYPDGRKVKNAYDAAGRPSGVSYLEWNGSQKSQSYMSVLSAGYDAAGHIIGADFGNGVSLAAAYDNRQRVGTLAYAKTQQILWGRNYEWTVNSNLDHWKDVLTNNQRHFSYDDLNRLTGAVDSSSSSSSGSTSSGSANVLSGDQSANNPVWQMNYGTIAWSSASAPDGSTNAATFTADLNSTNAHVFSIVPSPEQYNGQTMTGTVFLRVPSGTLNITLYMPYATNGVYQSPGVPITVTTTWQRFSITATLPGNLGLLALQLGGADTYGNGQLLQAWAPQMVVGSTASPCNSPCTYPTNLLTGNQTAGNPGWQFGSASPSWNSVAAPDGTSTAATFTADSGSDNSYFYNLVSNPAQYSTVTMTGSVYLRVPSGTLNTALYMPHVTNGSFQAPGNPITITTTWQRFSITQTLPNGLSVIALQVGGGLNFGHGQTVEVWGPEMVLGNTSTPPVASTPPSPPGTGPSNGMNLSYEYDSFGNLKKYGSVSNSYDSHNRVVGMDYDDSGNLRTTALATMTWDAESRISSANGVNYLYDAEGNRVHAGNTDTVYFGGRPIARYSNGQWTDLIYGPQGLIAEVAGQENAEPMYRFTDHLGTLVGNSDHNQTLLNPMDYTPFGQVFSGNTSDPYFFTGKERDTESGLDYFGARYYGSSMGRFMSPDDGSDQSPSNPQSWNLYSYGRNNPLIGRDDDGHTYRVCTADGKDCSNIDDKTFEANQKSDQQNGVQYSNGTISQKDDNGNLVKAGTYSHDPDIAGDPATNIAAMGRIGNQGMAAIRDFAIGSVVGGAAGAAGISYFGVMSVNVPTIMAPLLPVMPSAIDKLQKIGVSIQEANQIVNNPASQKLVDNLNGGNINFVQDIGGKMIRVTTDPTGQRIISAGTMRANQITNGLANGRFTK